MLIRHGKTAGNQEGRYIGSTDQPLCEAGIRDLQEADYQPAEQIYVSPLKRCIQTAGIIFPEVPRLIIEELRECDFGAFENKNYHELCHRPEYQAWLDSAGTMAFPGGEEPDVFRRRCCLGFEKVLADISQKGWKRAAMVVHGGTIMSILEAFAEPKCSFYDWQVKNGGGYCLQVDEELWHSGRKLRCRPLHIEKNGTDDC